jgi:hypothetical protein
MRKFFEDEDVIFETTFYSDKLKTTAVDPVTVVLELEKPDGTTVTPTVTQNGSRPANLGKYITDYIVTDYGVWAWRWKTETPRFVRQGEFEVVQNNQEN